MGPFSLSLATVDDHAAFARLFPELVVPDPIPTSEVFASKWLPRVVIARDEAGAVVGYSAWNLFGTTFHVANVVTAPQARGRGVGRALLDDLRVRAREAGCTRWYLNVKQDNAVAIRLYERCGFVIEQEGWTLDAKWDALASLPDCTRDVHAHSPSPDDDVALAARFAFDIARITRARERGIAVLMVVADDEPLGFAAFDPTFPGVLPIRVSDPTFARPLFAALRPHAKHDHTRVFVEADRALADVLQRAGARLEFALFRMGGSV
jgi:GNAT superfamily N-acetyltransferase